MNQIPDKDRISRPTHITHASLSGEMWKLFLFEEVYCNCLKKCRNLKDVESLKLAVLGISDNS